MFFHPRRVLICLDVTAVLQLQAEYSLSLVSTATFLEISCSALFGSFISSSFYCM